MTAADDLAELDGLIWAIAREHTREQPWLLEDAHQEAAIAAWQRLEEGHSKGIAIFKVRQAVLDVVRGRRMTGSKESGGIVDSHQKARSIFRTTPDGDEEYVYEPADLTTLDEQERIEARDALRAPLSVLRDDEREIVAAYYFEGLTSAEIAAERGVTPQAVRIRLKRLCDKMRAAA